MIVCHCNGISDQEIRRTVREGASSLGEVARACGAGTCCGGCHQAVDQIVTETLGSPSTHDDGSPLGVPALAVAAS